MKPKTDTERMNYLEKNMRLQSASSTRSRHYIEVPMAFSFRESIDISIDISSVDSEKREVNRRESAFSIACDFALRKEGGPEPLAKLTDEQFAYLLKLLLARV